MHYKNILQVKEMNETKCDVCGEPIDLPLYKYSLRLSPKQNPLGIKKIMYYCLNCAQQMFEPD